MAVRLLFSGCSVAAEDVSSAATEDVSSVATEDMCSVATEDLSSVATEDMSSVATEDMSSVLIQGVKCNTNLTHLCAPNMPCLRTCGFGIFIFGGEVAGEFPACEIADLTFLYLAGARFETAPRN